MSHMCGRSLSDKDRVFKKQFKTTDKNVCSVNRCTADLNCHSKTDGKLRAKRLKSRKERSQLRGGGGEASRSKSHHHHCSRQRSKDITFISDRCCQSSCHCSSRRDAPLSSVVPATQEPSIITDSRLIGHHGLFNHEVKSIDIERLLNKQRKMEKSGQQVHENNSTSHPSSAAYIPTPTSSNDLLGAEVVTLAEEEEPVAEVSDDFQMKDDKITQGSDASPGHKISHVRSEDCTPTLGRENADTQKQDSPVHQSQSHSVSESPLELPNSETAQRSVSQHPSIDPSSMSESVLAVAARLCGSLQLPALRRRNLVAESREVLLKALQERHGSRLQENLLKLQRYLSNGSDHSKAFQDQELTMIDEDQLQYTDAFTTEFQASRPFFSTQKKKSFRRKAPLNLQSIPPSHPNPKQMDEWFWRPEETSTSRVDDIFRSSPSAQTCMDFKPSGKSDRLFSHSPPFGWAEKNSQFPHWGDSTSMHMSKETFVFDSFENRLVNQTRAISGPHYTARNTQNFSNLHSTEPMHFPQEEDLFEAERYSLSSSFSSQVQHPALGHNFQPFSQTRWSSTCPPLRAHHTDMIHYPPSHILEREPAPSQSYFPSPEHWTFPPMRLY